MTTPLVLIFVFVFLYRLVGDLTMALGARVFGGKGTTPTPFWEGGYLWPVLLPVFLGGLLVAIVQAIHYWPHSPEDFS